jgi:hypothetical protein
MVVKPLVSFGEVKRWAVEASLKCAAIQVASLSSNGIQLVMSLALLSGQEFRQNTFDLVL